MSTERLNHSRTHQPSMLEANRLIRLEKVEGTLLFSFFLLFSFALLYIFRTADNNTLVSWKWVFGEPGFAPIFPYLLLGTVASLCLSSLPLERHPVAVLTVGAGLATIPLWGGPELMLDSGRYFLQAKTLAAQGIGHFFREWGVSIASWTDLPLVPLLYGLTLHYGYESRIAIQILNTVIFAMAVILTYKTGTLLWNRELGMYGGLFLAAMPYLLTQTTQMLVDTQAMFFLILAVYLFIRALKTVGRTAFSCAVMAMTAAAFVKYSLWPMLALLPVSCLVFYLEDRQPQLLKRGAGIVITAAFLSLVLLGLKYDVFSEQLRLLFTFQQPALKLWGEGIISSLLFQCHPVIVVLAVVSVCAAFRSRDKRFLIPLLFLSLVAMLQIKRVRYMIPLLPFLALMASYGLCAISAVQLRRYAGLLTLSSALVLVHLAYVPFLNSTSMMNIKMAGEALNALPGDQIEVVVLPQDQSGGSTFAAIPLLDLFTDKNIRSSQQWPMTPPAQLPAYSPLLFTWNMRKPAFYQESGLTEPTRPLVIISSGEKQIDAYLRETGRIPPPAPARNFTRYTQAFRYRTLIAVYE